MLLSDVSTILEVVALAITGALGTRAVTKNLSVVAEVDGIIKGLRHDRQDDYGRHARRSRPD